MRTTVGGLAVAVAIVLAVSSCLSGCVALGDDGARWCATACGPGGVDVCERTRVTCHPAAGACSVDRLLVTPVPAGPDGRERLGGRKAVAP